MHEIKSPFLILMEEQSYLAQSLESAFEKQNVKNTSGNILVSGDFFEFPSGRNKLHIGKTKWLPDLHKPGAFKKSGQRKSNG